MHRAAALVLLLACVAAGPRNPVEIDRGANEVRVACEALGVDVPLEYVCVVRGTADHESLLRTDAAPSAVHAGLLALGLEPGRPLRFAEAADRWLPPTGPPVRVEVEWEQDGRIRRERLGRLLRDVRTGRPMPPRTFVFVGSKTYEARGGARAYAADATGQVVSLVNFETPVVDVGELASSANETLEWEIDPDAAPPPGTMATMILSPVAADAPSTRPATRPADAPAVTFALVKLDADGNLSVDRVPTDLAGLPRAILATALPGRDGPPAVRVTAEPGVPLEAVGRLFGRLVESGLTDARFAPPPRPSTRPAGWTAFRPLYLNVGGDDERSIIVSTDRSGGGWGYTLGLLVRELESSARPFADVDGFDGDRSHPVIVRTSDDGPPVRAIDLAAPAAALFAAGFTNVSVEGYPALTEVAEAAGDPDDPDALRDRWRRRVVPQADALRMAAQTHYEVMQAYQDRINALLDRADALRREMDDLQAEFDDLTTPQPAPPSLPSPPSAGG